LVKILPTVEVLEAEAGAVVVVVADATLKIIILMRDKVRI
jgi:hypothetical protein